MTSERVDADSATVARQFDRRARHLHEHDALLRAVDAQLFERLEAIRLTPARVLDLGCGTGRSRAGLLARFPGATWVGLDHSLGMLRALEGGPTALGKCAGLAAALRGHWLRLQSWLPGQRPAGAAGLRLCAEAGHLPLADGSFDLVHANLSLHWHPQPHAAIAEAARVLRPGGLFLFSSYGPDTLARLREDCERALGRCAPMPCVDMHDWGDLLVEHGFEAPVIERQSLALSFAGPRELLREVRALGGNPRRDRAPGLPGGRRARQLHALIGARADAAGRVSADFEIVIGHGWRRSPRMGARVDGLATVALPRTLRAGA
jgi:malonyl-CoA O-methyltransferase